jgi:heme O synthase-like polyprenyltransferase
MAPRRRPATCSSYHAAGVQPDPAVNAYRLFHASNFYLLIILLAVLLGSLIQVP